MDRRDRRVIRAGGTAHLPIVALADKTLLGKPAVAPLAPVATPPAYCSPRRSITAGQASSGTRAPFKNYQCVGAILYESLLTA